MSVSVFVHRSVRNSLFPFIPLRVIVEISSNLVNIFITIRQILLIKMLGLGANFIRVISLCNSNRLLYRVNAYAMIVHT